MLQKEIWGMKGVNRASNLEEAESLKEWEVVILNLAGEPTYIKSGGKWVLISIKCQD